MDFRARFEISVKCSAKDLTLVGLGRRVSTITRSVSASICAFISFRAERADRASCEENEGVDGGNVVAVLWSLGALYALAETMLSFVVAAEEAAVVGDARTDTILVGWTKVGSEVAVFLRCRVSSAVTLSALVCRYSIHWSIGSKWTSWVGILGRTGRMEWRWERRL